MQLDNMPTYDLNKVEEISAFIANIGVRCFPGHGLKTSAFGGTSTSLIIVAYAVSLVSAEFSLHESMSPLAAVVILSVLLAK